MALVRDASGRVVHKASRRYALSWPKSKTDEVRRGRIYFARDALLPPGRYTVEVVAYDAQAATAGVDRVTLVAPAPAGDALRLSSLVVVGHTEPRATGEASPLQYQGLRLYPTFGEALAVGAGKSLAFVFTARPGRQPPGEATVELVHGTDTVRHADVPLPPPDASGDLRVVGGLPLDGLAAGEYTLRLVLSDGLSMLSRTADVRLSP